MEEQKKPKGSRREEVIKIIQQVNKIENKNNRKKSNKQKCGSLKRSIKLAYLLARQRKKG